MSIFEPFNDVLIWWPFFALSFVLSLNGFEKLAIAMIYRVLKPHYICCSMVMVLVELQRCVIISILKTNHAHFFSYSWTFHRYRYRRLPIQVVTQTHVASIESIAHVESWKCKLASWTVTNIKTNEKHTIDTRLMWFKPIKAMYSVVTRRSRHTRFHWDCYMV